jgi:hypothetical protein
MSTALCQEVADTIGQLFDCAEVNGFVRIRTPYLYPDGDVIDLYWKEQNGQQMLTDLGDTLRWLDTQSPSQQLSKKQNLLLQDIRLTHGVEIYRGTLLLRINPQESLATAITRLAQAALATADLSFLSRSRLIGSITDDIADFLQEKQIRFTQNEKLIGRSGRSRRLDFHAFHSRRTSFIEVLSTGSKSAANQRVDTVLATWIDFSHYKVGQQPTRFISLFDDTLDVWSGENIRQLQDFSDVAYWSRSDEFAELLTG